MIAVLVAVLLKGTLLMAAAAMAVALALRASAATRHFIWTLTMVGLLALPVMSVMLPTWQLAVPIASWQSASAAEVVRPALTLAAPLAINTPAAPTDGVDGRARPRPAQRLWWPVLVPAIYVGGVLILFARLLHQRKAARRIVGEATALTDREWIAVLNDCAARVGATGAVALRRSRIQLMPMTTGTITPSIVIPADADAWDADRRRAVLLHELAHIARHDCLAQMVSASACALYWFHPGVWYVARRLRIECEMACDDRVLAAGAPADEYAGHLLELAYGWSGRRAPAVAVGMASSRTLEGRIRAMLDPERNRTMASRRMWLVGAAAAAALLPPLAAMTMTTASADMRSTLMGPSAKPQEHERGAVENAAERPIGSRDSVAGTWELRRSGSRGVVLLRIGAGPFSWNGEFPASDIERLLSRPVANSTGPVRVSISREAGALDIEGSLNDGTGSGTFRFVPSETFIAALTARGFNRPNAQQLFALAQNNIGLEFIDGLAAQQYERPDIEALVRASQHGVDADFLREMGRAGYRVGSLEALIRFRDHGVDPDYVRGMRALGVSDLAPDDIVRARDHGVNPEYVADLGRLGYSSLPFDMLIRARDHGVDGEYLRGMRRLGYTFALDEAISARDHGVDPDFATGMRRLGYTLTAGDLIRARDHGVDREYVEDMALEGYTGLPIETLVRLRDHGVTPDYVQQARKRGRDKLSPEEIIQLRDRGDGIYERKIGQWNYHVERLLARLRDSETGREIEKALERLMR